MWDTLLIVTRTVASMIGAMLPHIESLVAQWSEAPESAQAQRAEALALLGQLHNSLSGALDRADIRDLEAK